MSNGDKNADIFMGIWKQKWEFPQRIFFYIEIRWEILQRLEKISFLPVPLASFLFGEEQVSQTQIQKKWSRATLSFPKKAAWKRKKKSLQCLILWPPICKVAEWKGKKVVYSIQILKFQITLFPPEICKLYIQESTLVSLSALHNQQSPSSNFHPRPAKTKKPQAKKTRAGREIFYGNGDDARNPT